MVSELDKAEYESLQASVANAETGLTFASENTRQVLNDFLNGARGRMVALEKKMKDAKEEEIREKETADVVVAEQKMKVERETALSSSEKETYGHFLSEEFFTKKDFGQLEKFYAHSWDRLTEGGKEEMSERVWEGIKRHEYTFDELPQVVQKDESKQLYMELTGKAKAPPGAANIPEQDKADFVHEYEAGDKKGVAKVLSRKSFSENLGSQTAVSTDTAEQKKSDGTFAKTAQKQNTTLAKDDTDALAFDDGKQASVCPTTLNKYASTKPTVSR